MGVEVNGERSAKLCDDTALRQYLTKRDALIQEERKQRHDHHFLQCSPSATVVQACNIVSAIRARELTHDLSMSARALARETTSPGAMFNPAKSRVHSTDLWKIVRRMPKGSLLHAHLEALFDVDHLVTQCLATPGMYIYAKNAIISSVDFDKEPFSFRYCSKGPKGKGSIWTVDYESGSLVPVTSAAHAFPHGGEAGFRSWVKKRCTIGADRSGNVHDGADAVWDRFKQIFPILISMAFYEPIFRRALHRLFRELVDDGIQYVELRMGSAIPFQREAQDTPDEDHGYLLEVVREEILAFQQTKVGMNFYGARIIYTAPRISSEQELVARMERCIHAKQQFPQLICGFDLVGQEDRRALVDLVPVLLWFRQRCGEEGVEIPFFFHAGECLGDGDATDHNLFDAVLLDSRRIGHGLSLYKHPLLIDIVKEKNISIECCVVSNEVLRLTSSIQTHPLPALLARGVSVCLCNDDPAIFGQGMSGLSVEFWQTLQGLENMGLAGLAAMAQNSIRWSCYEDLSSEEWQSHLQNSESEGNGLNAMRLRQWRTQFEAFCQWIVDEFGPNGTFS
ncbi:CECR1 family adenosine deaminase [Aspergillus nomiae NRRL 13137]|uniref:adenosine deaminase n=1 Tax=Aspergillus nomiae NRRL (strain ATCC 15546 / NRRL 13137 / CBS 260.88 / M93) TaxID=1509407 RepID=A0A0L1IKY5_ASPN3|nr:CECR1 family adenosine deaminase [Aspergillus nomiae NRRL 13137]KNG80234.1 CECR1 family adenosine deaminase [Aspergillus nomiae NRRL 13137]